MVAILLIILFCITINSDDGNNTQPATNIVIR